MTLSNQTVKQLYSGDNSTTTFAIPFGYITPLTESEVVVILKSASAEPYTETTQVNPTHYSIVGTNVEMVTAPTSAQKLLVKRVLTLQQLLDYITTGAFPADDHEDAMDRFVMMAQQLNEMISRSLLLKATSAYSNLVLPDPEADKYLRWKDDLSGLENVETFSNRAGTTTISNGATQVAVTFSSAMDDTNYAIAAQLLNTTDSSVDFQPITITSKSTSGFTAAWNSGVSSGNYKLSWMVVEHN